MVNRDYKVGDRIIVGGRPNEIKSTITDPIEAGLTNLKTNHEPKML